MCQSDSKLLTDFQNYFNDGATCFKASLNPAADPLLNGAQTTHPPTAPQWKELNEKHVTAAANGYVKVSITIICFFPKYPQQNIQEYVPS